MKEITEAYKGYLSVREKAQLSCEREMNYSLARKIGECKVFKGTEDLDQIVNILFSAQGIEFAIRWNYPTIDTLRSFLKHDPTQYGVYIDAGEITITNRKRIIVAGNTKATILCDDTELYRIVCLHGASCTINATGFSVIKAEADSQSTIKINKAQHAQIL